jgi:hypothetical protein
MNVTHKIVTDMISQSKCVYYDKGFCKEKSRIRETPNLSTDADSSTDTCLPAATANGAGNNLVLIVGIPENTK